MSSLDGDDDDREELLRGVKGEWNARRPRMLAVAARTVVVMRKDIGGKSQVQKSNLYTCHLVGILG